MVKRKKKGWVIFIELLERLLIPKVIEVCLQISQAWHCSLDSHLFFLLGLDAMSVDSGRRLFLRKVLFTDNRNSFLTTFSEF